MNATSLTSVFQRVSAMYTVLQNRNNWLSYSGPNPSFLICKYVTITHKLVAMNFIMNNRGTLDDYWTKCSSQPFLV